MYWIFLTLFFSSCASYKIPTEEIGAPIDPAAPHHWLYKAIPRHRSQIRSLDILHWTMWVLFGNDDDGIFGENETARYRPNQPISFWKACRWNLRNPLHNFCSYVIGTAGSPTDSFVILEISKERFVFLKYFPLASTAFPEDLQEKSRFFLALHGKKPFFFLRLSGKTRMLETYFGWRCKGNFGIKFLPFKKKKYYHE